MGSVPSFNCSRWDKKLNVSEAFPVLKSQQKDFWSTLNRGESSANRNIPLLKASRWWGWHRGRCGNLPFLFFFHHRMASPPLHIWQRNIRKLGISWHRLARGFQGPSRKLIVLKMLLRPYLWHIWLWVSDAEPTGLYPVMCFAEEHLVHSRVCALSHRAPRQSPHAPPPSPCLHHTPPAWRCFGFS